MTRGRLVVVAAAAGAIVAVALLVTLARSGDVAPRPGAQPVRPAVRADLQPRTHGFGDTVSATLQLTVPSDALVVDTVVATAGRSGGLGRGATGPVGAFDPYELVAPPVRDVERGGGLTIVRYTLRLRCLAGDCLPDGDSKAFEFPNPTFVWSVRAPPGRRFADRQLDQRRASGFWPTLTVARGIPADRLTESGWRSALVELPTAGASVSPRTLANALLGAAGLLVVAAAALLGLVAHRELRRRERALVRAEAPPLPLEQALRLVESLNGRGDERERRVALETLASELRRADRAPLAYDAERLAWEEGDPDHDAMAALAAEARASTQDGGGS